MRNRNTRKKPRGGALAFSVVLILVLIMIGLAFFAISLYFGGAQETKDAVNSGALNVARKALDITVPLSGDPNQQYFTDVSENGNISLRSINRVWSKAMFCAINAEAAGSNAGGGTGDATTAHDTAQAISDALTAKLNDPNNHYNDFENYAAANSVRMLGLGASVQKLPGADWTTSMLERKFEGNIESENNLPAEYTTPGNMFTSTLRSPAPGDASGKQWVTGYQPLHVNGQDFWQVAYPFEQKPHLVDRKFFDDNKSTPLNEAGGTWNNPVPNSFGVAGIAGKSSNGYSETAVSWAETNPQQTFPMQIPNGFIKITLKKNDLQFCPDGAPLYSDTYGFTVDSKDSPPFPVGCGDIRATAYVGFEYITGTLLQAVIGTVPPNPGEAMNHMLQRCQEMAPGYSMAELTGLLTATFISPDDSDQTFLLYPTPDGKHMLCTSDSGGLPGYLSNCDASSDADGSQYTIDTEPPIPAPNWALGTLDCYGSYPMPAVATTEGERKWTPGTSFTGGCLGHLEIHRTTKVYYFGVCPCP